MSIFSTVIACINFSENNEEIIRYTKLLAQKDTKIILVHIIPLTRQILNNAPNIVDFLQEAEEKNKKNLLTFQQKFFAEHDTETIILSGNSTESILQLADERCAELIIMGTMSSKHWFDFAIPKPYQRLTDMSRVPVMLIPNDLDLECMPPEDM